jgi:hypothetical protein
VEKETDFHVHIVNDDAWDVDGHELIEYTSLKVRIEEFLLFRIVNDQSVLIIRDSYKDRW